MGDTALMLVSDLGWTERAAVLLAEQDLAALLRDPEAMALPREQRRALAYLNLGQHVHALADLERALEINPEDTSALRWRLESKLHSAPEEFRQGLFECDGL